MTPRQLPEPDLVKRLLADAEEKAAEGRIREGYVLLRWASRLAPRNVVPVVLLTYHRLRTAGQVREGEVGNRGLRQRGASGLGVSASHGGGVTADALGFPVPRFPTRAPDLDRTAFVPAPQRADEVRPITACPPHTPADRGRPGWLDWRTPVMIAALVAVAEFAVGRPGTRHAGEWMETVRGDPVDAADQALRAGEPARALAITQEVADPGPRVLLIRGRAEIALGDTASACVAEQSAAAHPQANAVQAWEAAEVLARVLGKEDAAAEAYLRAFSLGLAPEKWEGVAHGLDRAGRTQQAARIRELIRISARTPACRTCP